MTSSGWSGFTDDDLKQLQSTNEVSECTEQRAISGAGAGVAMQAGKKNTSLTSRPRPQRAVQPMKKQPNAAMNSEPGRITDAARLSTPKPAAVPEQHVENRMPNSEPASADAAETASVAVPASPESSHCPQPDIKPTVLLTEIDGRSRELSNLEQYHQQQKMMEELNKKKKQLLAETLAQRQKQAKVEAHKLNAIKKELSHLDQMLTADVNVIRDRIEEETREYAEASKRYDLAEKEFIAAKINLHNRNEMKGQLTEHLYTIIHQNEVRKAKKLAELMEKLDLATEEADSGVDTTLAPLPSYSILGNMQTVASGNLAKHSISVENSLPSPAESDTKTVGVNSSPALASPAESDTKTIGGNSPPALEEHGRGVATSSLAAGADLAEPATKAKDGEEVETPVKAESAGVSAP